ncbi:MAG: hypothetical protein RJB13_2545 [Pseudomonadota bacterium]
MHCITINIHEFARRLIFGLMILMLTPRLAVAYPVFVEAKSFSRYFGLQRASLIAISSDKDTKKRIPIQIDEVEDGAALVLRNPYSIRELRGSLAHPKKNDPFFGRLQSVHRIVLDDRDFGLCDQSCQDSIQSTAREICKSPTAQVLLKVSLQRDQRSAFIVDCGIKPAENLINSSISFDEKKSTISTPKYEYTYLSDKNIFFKNIKLSGNEDPILGQSEIKAFLKPKYLFNLKFQDDDLISQITSISRNSHSLSLEVAMALNLLAMKINNQICCDVSFYEDSLYFPVVLDLPFSGSSFADGSGVFFGFQRENGAQLKTEYITAKSPDTSDAIIIEQNGSILVIGMRNSNSKRKNGARPVIVSQKDMTKMDFLPVVSKNGIFYDIQNTEKGFHHFNVWIFLGAIQDKEKLVEYAQKGPQINTEYMPDR